MKRYQAAVLEIRETPAVFHGIQRTKSRRSEPRKEMLDVAAAQVESAQSALKTAKDELDKQATTYKSNLRSISKDALDSAVNASAVPIQS